MRKSDTRREKIAPPAIKIEIAPGELFDRATILALKARRLSVRSKVKNVSQQRAALLPYERALLKQFPRIRADVRALARANRILWDAEDRIRALSSRGDFDARFVAVAKRIHETNDERARLKRAITDACGSRLHEEKLYTKVTPKRKM